MKRKKIFSIILSAMLLLQPISAYAGTWEKSTSSSGSVLWKYKQDNGTYINNGWKQINGDWYYFFANHIMTNYTVKETDQYGRAVNDIRYFVDESGKMIKGGFCKVYGDSLMFADSTGKVVRGFFMVDDVLYHVSEKENISAAVTPNYRAEMRDKFQCADGKERTLHYIYDGGKVLELDGNPIKSDDKFYQLIKYIPKYNSQGVLVGEIRN